MAAFETLFNLTYLVLVIGFGLALLIDKDIKAKIFGWMGVLLGFGDGFHLLPRIISHLSEEGFEGHISALSWGQMVTSITMTIFYLLFYFYYVRISGDEDRKKRHLIFLLTILRIILVLMPQNDWGSNEGSYIFGIYRNVPFAIMGLMLVIWSYKKRYLNGLKNMWLLISLSFIFYIPVVLFKDKYPVVGALMMPKTLAYLLLVICGVKTFFPYFGKRNILSISFSTLILGLVAGVFYREFTKFNKYEGITHLSKVHPHILVLGFIFSLIIYIIMKRFSAENIEKLGKNLKIYLTGLLISVVSMLSIGIWEVLGSYDIKVAIKVFEGISGIGHLLLGLGLVKIIILIIKNEREEEIL